MRYKNILLGLMGIIIFSGHMFPQTNSARARWEILSQIRRDKFDLILPKVMRENNIDMWITVMREGNYGPLYYDLG